jgi:hypothetical protein
MIRLLGFLAAMCLATAAQAQNVWSTPGSACTPSADTVAAANYRTNVESVQHAAGDVGQIVLFCPMPRFNSGTTDWNLTMTYRDSTGTGTGAFVRARVYRAAIGTIPAFMVGVVNSNSSASTVINSLAGPTFTHTFDFEANIYWLQVELNRSSTAQTVFFYSAVLDGALF